MGRLHSLKNIIKTISALLIVIFNKNGIMKNKLLLILLLFYQNIFLAQDSIRAVMIEPVYINSHYSDNVTKNSKLVNISDDKEFAILYKKKKEQCVLKKIKIDVQSYVPENENEYVYLRFYKNNNDKIGAEFEENRMFVKLKNTNRTNFQLIFNLTFQKEITDNSFFIGISLINESEKIKNANSVFQIYSSKDKGHMLYIRNNKIDYWLEETKIAYSNKTKVFFPSIQVIEDCDTFKISANLKKSDKVLSLIP